MDTAAATIFGSGEAKTELRKRLLTSHPAMQVVLMEPGDNMTENQISAKVREYLGFGAERRQDTV